MWGYLIGKKYTYKQESLQEFMKTCGYFEKYVKDNGIKQGVQLFLQNRRLTVQMSHHMYTGNHSFGGHSNFLVIKAENPQNLLSPLQKATIIEK